MRLRWGLLGTASINDVILESCRGSELVQFGAVASREPKRARDYASARGIASAYGSYRELLEDPEIDAIYVSVPNGLHMQWSHAALDAGKHVLCEKPLSRQGHEIARLHALAGERGLLFGEAFMYRHHPQTELLCEAVQHGAIGELRLMRSSHSFPMPVQEWPTRLPLELDAGALMDLGCYAVSISRLLAGEPETVFGERVMHPTGVDMRFAGSMRFAGDVVSWFDCAMDLPLRNSLEVVGSEGALLLGDPWHCRAPSFWCRREGEVREIEVPDCDPYRLQFEAFARAVGGERNTAFDPEGEVSQAGVLAALQRSAELGRPLSLS